MAFCHGLKAKAVAGEEVRQWLLQAVLNGG